MEPLRPKHFDIPDPSPSPEALTIEQDIQERLQRIFRAELSPRDAELMIALYFGGNTTVQVARLFSISEHRVRNIRKAALKILRALPEITSILRPSKRTR